MNKRTNYLIVGSGRTAKHTQHYFSLLDIPFNSWNRSSAYSFSESIGTAYKILVLITDDAVENFITESKHLVGDHVTWIHFSGALSTPLAESAHPLMTFGESLYDLDVYKNIPFITETGRKSFKELFSELPNKSFAIETEKKAFYHAWCSIAGNFTSILWKEFFFRLENDLGIKRESSYPYLFQIISNVMTNGNPVTGPLARGDEQTIKKHLSALNEDPFKRIYESFVEVYELTKEKEGVK